jgi:hypothetical protein
MNSRTFANPIQACLPSCKKSATKSSTKGARSISSAGGDEGTAAVGPIYEVAPRTGKRFGFRALFATYCQPDSHCRRLGRTAGVAEAAFSRGKIRISRVCDNETSDPPDNPCMTRPNTNMPSELLEP